MSLHDDHRPGFESNFDPECSGCAGKKLHGLADYIQDVLGISYEDYQANLKTLSYEERDRVISQDALPIYLAIRGYAYLPIPQAIAPGMWCPRCQKNGRDPKGILLPTDKDNVLCCDICRYFYKRRLAIEVVHEST